MKKFIHHLSIFILPLLLLAYPADILLSSLLKQSNYYRGEFEIMNDIYNGEAKTEVAIYGSSRAWVQFNPQILADTLEMSAYNFGIDGHNFWLQYWRHLELVKFCGEPKLIIMAVDVFSLQRRHDLYNSEQFLPYMLWDDRINNFTSSYIGFSWIDYFIPFIRYNNLDALKSCYSVLLNNDGKKRFRINGFKGMDLKWNADLERARGMMEAYEAKLHQPSVELFENFINECKYLNINLILVYAPTYIDGHRFIKNRDELIKVYEDLSIKYDLLFLNYSEHEISYTQDLFYNSTHLNSEGANIFTGVLARDIKNYLDNSSIISKREETSR